MKKIIVHLHVFIFSLVSAGIAQADQKPGPVYSINFKTPSGNIVCGGDIKDASRGMDPWAGVSCLIGIKNNPIREKPKDCELDWGGMFTLSQKGETVMECYGDFPFEINARVLNYGESIQGDGWKCSSQKNGLSCINEEKHGFKIKRSQQVLF